MDRYRRIIEIEAEPYDGDASKYKDDAWCYVYKGELYIPDENLNHVKVRKGDMIRKFSEHYMVLKNWNNEYERII